MCKVKNVAVIAVFVVLIFLSGYFDVSAENEDTWISEIAQEACVEYGNQYGICPELLMAIIETESSGQADAENNGCCGLMQVAPKWHKERMNRLGVTDIYDESGNILVGTDYLAELFAKYGEASLVLDKYNGNSKADYNYENGILSRYAKKVLERSAELEKLHGK